MVVRFWAKEMTVKKFHIIIAYRFLCVSVLTLAISFLISVLSLIDVLFRIGFGYPLWSVAIGGAFVVLGFALTKASLGYLKMVKR
jgi:hypothetical protein